MRIERGSAQLRHTRGTLSILSTTESLVRTVELVNSTGVEDLGMARLVGGTRNGLISNALGKRPSVISDFAGRGVTSFVMKLFGWKFWTLVLQTAHCMSFSPTIFSALREPVFSTHPTRTKKEPHLVKQAEQRGWSHGSKIARTFARIPQIEQLGTSGSTTWGGMMSSTPNAG